MPQTVVSGGQIREASQFERLQSLLWSVINAFMFFFTSLISTEPLEEQMMAQRRRTGYGGGGGGGGGNRMGGGSRIHGVTRKAESAASAGG